MKINANAKINLTLDITGVRDDGFHTLRSVMVPITLADELIFEKSDDFSFECDVPSLNGDDNICVRAARLFFETAGIKPSVSVKLKKQIPFPAGLGGGSADAAAMLKGLNAFYQNPLDEKTLFSLAERLGSDVPICLFGRAALCEGRGEILTPLAEIDKLNVVIAIGDARLSTPAAYKKLDELNLPVRHDSDNFLNAHAVNDFGAMLSSLGNAFEPVADLLAPETKLLRERLVSLGAENARLSGSGPSVFGIFENEEIAKNAVKALKGEGFSAYFCKTL